VQAELDEQTYPKGVKVTDKQMIALRLHKHEFHPDWNYTLHPINDKVVTYRPLAGRLHGLEKYRSDAV
jgi:hypothetical protein